MARGKTRPDEPVKTSCPKAPAQACTASGPKSASAARSGRASGP